MKTIIGSIYDWREFIPIQCHRALEALGIQPGIIHGWNGRLKGAVFEFSFTCKPEDAKYVVSTFLTDEYGAEAIRFYAKPTDNTKCYACFDWHKRKANV